MTRDGKGPYYLAFYGSLMRGQGAQEAIGVAAMLEFVGACLIEGALYDLGEYPALVPAAGSIVHGELFRVIDPAALSILDRYEDWRADDPRGSLFVRRAVLLVSPGVLADVYFYNQPVGGNQVPHGDWKRFVAER